MADYLFDKTFDFDKRELVAKTVQNKLEYQLPNLGINWSWECGFELPLSGTEWVNKDYGKLLNSIIKYHNSRQMRFHTLGDKLIDGIRFKDGIKYWSDDEVKLIVSTVNQVIQELDL